MTRLIALVSSLGLVFLVPLEGVAGISSIGTGARLMGLVTFAFWLVSAIMRRRLRKPTSFHTAVYLFVFWNALSVFWSVDTDETLVRLATWFQVLVLIVVIWDLYTSRTVVMAGLQAYVWGAYVAVGVAVSNYLSGSYSSSGFLRYTAGNTNPDEFGLILAIGVPIAWMLAAAKPFEGKGRLLSAANLLFVPVALFGIALSGTRTALIAIVPGMVFGLVLLSRLRFMSRTAVGLLLAIALIGLAPTVIELPSFQRLGTTGSSIASQDLGGRMDLWRAGVASFTEHPILGVGSNAYRSVNDLSKVAHNSFLSVLVETGVVGFALFGGAVLLAVLQAWRMGKWDRRFWLVTIATWAIGALTLTFEHNKVTWLLLSFAIAAGSISRDTGFVSPRAGSQRRAGDQTSPTSNSRY